MAQVIIPFGGDDPQRLRVRDFLMARYKARFPSWEVVLGESDEKPWCKAKAVMPAVRNAPSDVVVIADADCWCDEIESAVRAVTVGAAEWAIPHKMVYRLTEEATESLLTTNGPERPPVQPQSRADSMTLIEGLSNQTERRPYEGVWGGGIVAAHRDTLLRVPLDSRFRGPGQEDEALGISLWTLAGPGWRGKGDLVHLWHPPLPRLSHRRGSVESWELYRRYQMANRNPDEMKALINESSSPDEPLVPDRAPLGVGSSR